MSQNTESLQGRALIAGQVTCVFLALLTTTNVIDYSNNPISIIVAALSLSIPVWYYQGITWVFRMKVIPIWSIFLFIPALFLNLWPLIEYEFIWPYAIVMVLIFSGFRWLHNYGAEVCTSDKVFLQFLHRNWHHAVSGIIILMIIQLLCFGVSNFADYYNDKNAELKESRADSPYMSDWLRSGNN